MFGSIGIFAAWGSFVALGATGYFTDAGLYDARRSLIVLVCTAIFIAFWSWVFLRPRPSEVSKEPPRVTGSTAESAGTSWTSVVSLLMMVAAYGTCGGAWLTRFQADRSLRLGLSIMSLGFFGLAAILAVIGLSDARPRRWKLLGLVTLAFLVLAVAALVIAPNV